MRDLWLWKQTQHNKDHSTHCIKWCTSFCKPSTEHWNQSHIQKCLLGIPSEWVYVCVATETTWLEEKVFVLDIAPWWWTVRRYLLAGSQLDQVWLDLFLGLAFSLLTALLLWIPWLKFFIASEQTRGGDDVTNACNPDFSGYALIQWLKVLMAEIQTHTHTHTCIYYSRRLQFPHKHKQWREIKVTHTISAIDSLMLLHMYCTVIMKQNKTNPVNQSGYSLKTCLPCWLHSCAMTHLLFTVWLNCIDINLFFFFSLFMQLWCCNMKSVCSCQLIETLSLNQARRAGVRSLPVNTL